MCLQLSAVGSLVKTMTFKHQNQNSTGSGEHFVRWNYITNQKIKELVSPFVPHVVTLLSDMELIHSSFKSLHPSVGQHENFSECRTHGSTKPEKFRLGRIDGENRNAPLLPARKDFQRNSKSLTSFNIRRLLDLYLARWCRYSLP